MQHLFLCLLLSAAISAQVQITTTSKAGDRFKASSSPFTNGGSAPSKNLIQIDTTVKYQEIIGFGSSFTESAAYTFSTTSPENQQKIIDWNWGSGNDSNRYTLGRLVIGSCDYSLNFHSYADVWEDESMSHFSIDYDKKMILPFIQRAVKAANGKLKLVGSVWSPPAWMKSSGKLAGGGSVKPKYYKALALYISKWISAYQAQGVPVWGVTPQNEPEANNGDYPCCNYNPQQEAAYIKEGLGPMLAANHSDVKLLAFDHNRDDLPWWADTLYSDAQVAKYIWGMGFHWYAPQDHFDNVQNVHNKYPNKHLVMTEAAACSGDDWFKAEKFGYDIINDLNVWAEGFIQWNAVLQRDNNWQWGPFEGLPGKHRFNPCQPPLVTVGNQLIRSPSYYYIGHFSRFITPGSHRVKQSGGLDNNVFATSFLTPQDQVVVVVQNKNNYGISSTVSDRGHHATVQVPANGIVTLQYPNKF